MKYASLQEYFYKFQNALYLLVLLPLIVFIFFFIFPSSQPDIVSAGQTNLVINILIAVIIVDWLIAFVLFRVMLSPIKSRAGLGLKLEQYYRITLVRFALLTASGLMMAMGYFLSNHAIFSLLLGLNLIFALAFWPRPSKVCRDLQLRNDEREMVYYKKTNL